MENDENCEDDKLERDRIFEDIEKIRQTLLDDSDSEDSSEDDEEESDLSRFHSEYCICSAIVFYQPLEFCFIIRRDNDPPLLSNLAG